jgi:DNA-binding SARP family transcriptional activator/Tfp pilus assembly protein PilF
MWFGLLGALEVRDADQQLHVTAARQRVLLAAMLLSPGQVVSGARLAELVWDAQPPASAAVTLRSYVKRLRQALGPAGSARVLSRSGGYLIEVAPDELDIARYEALCATGETALRAGAWQLASDTLAGAQRLWRGTPLADIPGQALQAAEVPRLEELRMQAIQWRIEADLQLGRSGRVLPELQALTAAHPLREAFQGQLMLALYRCGRTADALAAFRQARTTLIDEIGVEPGRDLRLLHERMLAGDPGLEAAVPAQAAARPARTAPPAGGREVPVPRELPPVVASFTGRDAELAALDALLGAPPAGAPLTMLITAIGGTAGVGKTALAVQWAHRITELFPDGQLYVNLRGYDPGQPMPAGDALAGFLRALGVAGQDIPPEEGERTARYRSLLAMRRMLVVLDNARDADQVRPLLPGTPDCAAIVTSRDALAGLVAREGARRLDLDLLPLSDAVGLLRALIGSRVEAEPEAAAALATSCCRLPLALRVAAELAAARPGAPLADLAVELADQQQRLDLLDAGGDVRAAVRTVFSWSYRHLDPASAEAFRLIGEHPGTSYDAHAVAALASISAARAGQMLDQLHRAYLVQSAGPGRYGQHDLLRAYARELASNYDSPAQRRAAQARLIDYYLHAAGAAMDAVFPAERDSRPRFSPPVVPVTASLDDPAAARAWLDSERANLAAVASLAAGHYWPRQACDLAAVLHRYLDKGGHYSEAVIIHDCARRAAGSAGNRNAEATALVNLATVDGHQGRYEQAVAQLLQALPLFADAGDLRGQARALSNLGAIEFYQGHLAEADRHLREAVDLVQPTGDVVSEARMLSNLGTLNIQRGHYEQARGYLRRALAICDRTGNLTGKAHVLGVLGEADLRSGHHQRAARYLQEALDISSRAADRAEQARVLCDLGLNELRLDRPAQAIAHLQQALRLAREIGEQSVMVQAHAGIGEVMLSAGRTAAALDAYEQSLELASQLREVHGQARAHEGLGDAHHAAGDPGLSRYHWQQALALYGDLDVPEANRVRVQLAATAS